MTGGSEPPGLKSFSAASLHGISVPKREWIAKDIIPARKVTLLMGDGGTGKSTLALQLAVAVASGRPWLGQVISEGSVLYLSAEDDREELHRRLVQICLANEVVLEGLQNLRLVDLSEADPVMASAKGTDLESTPLFLKLEATIFDLCPKLLIIDSLADFFGGDEIKRRHAVAFIGMFRRLCSANNLTVLILGHPSVSGISSGSGTSGSSAWNNSVRSRLSLDREKPCHTNSGEFGIRVLRNKKANYGPTGTEIRMRWQAGTFFELETRHADRSSRMVGEEVTDKKFLELLDLMKAEGKTLSNVPGRNYAPTLFAANSACGGITMQGFKAAMDRLFNAGVLRIDTVGPPSRQKNSIVYVGS